VTGWIAIDGGQSEVRVRHSGAGRAVMRGPGYVHGPRGVDRIVEAIREAVSGTTPPTGATVGLGHTGHPADALGKAELAGALLELFDASEVRTGPDWVTAHLGALEGRPGIVLAVGTGAVCLGSAPERPSVVVGGWGPVFGDAGSAFWIGRAGIEAGLRHEDGRATTPALHAATKRVFGADLHVATDQLYAADDLVDRVAQFAPSVLQAAEDGDSVALDIVRRAVAAYVELITATIDGLGSDGPVTISYSGGVLNRSPQLVSMLQADLTDVAPRAQVVVPSGDGLAGAELLASTTTHPFGDLVVRTPRSAT
jgi:N-acetylglucosamine kinase-like BadF-type ATPase